MKRWLFEKYLGKDENIFFTIHRHWVTIQGQMIRIALLGYFLPILILVFIAGLTSPLSYVCYLWILLAFGYSLYAFLDWYLDAWLVTDVSIIDTIWDGFFKQRSSRIDYDSIESIDIAQRGLKQTLLNYGTIVLIKNSGINVSMPYVHRPQRASRWISRVQAELATAKGNHDANAIKNLLADIIQEHIQVNS